MNSWLNHISILLILSLISCTKQQEKTGSEQPQDHIAVQSVKNNLMQVMNQQSEMSIDEIIEKHIDQCGKDLYYNSQSLVFKGKYYQFGTESDFALYIKDNNKLRYETWYMDEYSYIIINEEKTYKKHIYKFPEDTGAISPSERDAVIQKADLGQTLFWNLKKGLQIDSLKMVNLNGKITYALVHKIAPNKEDIYFVDTTDFNLLEFARMDKALNNHLTYEIRFHNYVQQQGISVPLLIEYYNNSQLYNKFIIDSLRFNTVLNDSLFSIPT